MAPPVRRIFRKSNKLGAARRSPGWRFFLGCACAGFAFSAFAQTDKEPAVDLAQRALAEGNGPQARRILLPAAWRGEADAAYWLGRLYFYDEAGIARNDRLARFWFSRAARAGHPGGQYKLGSLYFTGRGVVRNLREAMRWWRAAALNGHAESLNNLGALIAVGEGVAADADLGMALQIMAAEKGSDTAQENLRGKTDRPLARDLAQRLSADPAMLAERLDRLLEGR